MIIIRNDKNLTEYYSHSMREELSLRPTVGYCDNLIKFQPFMTYFSSFFLR